MGRTREPAKNVAPDEQKPDPGENSSESAEKTLSVVLEIPIVAPRNGSSRSRLEISRMTYSQIRGLHLLVSSLDEAGATLENGVRVTNAVTAFRWIMEQLAAKLPEDWKPERYR
jgi:hypothetical protein